MLNAHQELTKVMQDYFGPVAQRFVDRQITSQLDKEPDELTYDDIPKLISPIEEWLYGFSGDKNLTLAVVSRIKRLAGREMALAH